MASHYDVLIIGGGPAGSTLGALLRRYNPGLKILIVEREVFPRDHIGESQLAAISLILDEMGAWGKVEAANFPVKVGSTYRWGKTEELWQVNFLPDEFRDAPRPGKFQGQRRLTAFQVDRSLYDTILLDHAESLGCEVRQAVRAVSLTREGDRVTSVTICPAEAEGPREEVTARYYVDGSGGSGFLRREMDVEIDSPTCLRNVALYKYWQDTDWAENIGNGGTRAQILSIGWGWIWFIPIRSTRTSIGVVTPASYLKSSGKSPEELYFEGLASSDRISGLLTNARQEERFYATKDWSYLAERLAGENWFLIGDACGFADPILSAGMTLAQVGARKLACTVLELDRGKLVTPWLKAEFSRSHRANIRQHIRFAEFWYAGNGCFTDLNEFCAQIAQDAGLNLNPEEAFQWIGTGGFAADTFSEVNAITQRFQSSRNLIGRMIDQPEWKATKNNVFKMNVDGARSAKVAFYRNGGVDAVDCLERDEKVLPMVGPNLLLAKLLSGESDGVRIAEGIHRHVTANRNLFPNPASSLTTAIEALETMIAHGWVDASVDPSRPFIRFAA